MKWAVVIASLYFIGLLAEAQFNLNHDCVLIIEGLVNQIMVPLERRLKNPDFGRGDLNQQEYENFVFWQKVNEDGTLVAEFLETGFFNAYSDKYYMPSKNIHALRHDMHMEDNCPTVPFQFYRGFNREYERVATGYIARSPLNTLCRPQQGIIIFGCREEEFDDANSLYECATKAVTRGDQAKAVQWDDGVCKAFYGPNSEVVPLVGMEKTTLACVLGCNRIPFMGPAGTGVVAAAADFEMCKSEGITREAKSVSFDTVTAFCHIYETDDSKTISYDGTVTGCYIP